MLCKLIIMSYDVMLFFIKIPFCVFFYNYRACNFNDPCGILFLKIELLKIA